MQLLLFMKSRIINSIYGCRKSFTNLTIDTTNTLRLHFLWLKYNLITSLSVDAFFAINLHNFTFSLAAHGSEERSWTGSYHFDWDYSSVDFQILLSP